MMNKDQIKLHEYFHQEAVRLHTKPLILAVIELNELRKKVSILGDIFLTCPECGGDCKLIDFHDTYFMTQCDCTKWKIDFSIKEV